MQKTLENLAKAFVGESQARNRYTFYAKIAKKEGYEQVSALFIETADNEKEHAKMFFKYLKDGAGKPLEITASYPSGYIGDTKENLKMAADGEKEEWETLYPEFERVAREEGFLEIASTFKEIAEVEEEHEKRYRKLLSNIEENKVFKREGDNVSWKCRNCGYVHEGDEAPGVCPACKHPQSYYELFFENY